jgi:hypothetical protein
MTPNEVRRKEHLSDAQDVYQPHNKSRMGRPGSCRRPEIQAKGQNAKGQGDQRNKLNSMRAISSPVLQVPFDSQSPPREEPGRSNECHGPPHDRDHQQQWQDVERAAEKKVHAYVA